MYDSQITQLDISRDAIGTLKKGTDVNFIKDKSDVFIERTTDDILLPLGLFAKDDTFFYLDCIHVIPANTESLFDSVLLTDFNNQKCKWVPAYYADVLRSQDRNMVLALRPWWDNEDNQFFLFDRYYPKEWYETFAWMVHDLNALHITNSVIIIDDTFAFGIKNIKKISSGYRVTVKPENQLIQQVDEFDWSPVKNKDSFERAFIIDKDTFDMIFIIDGEFLDVYLDNFNQKLETYIFINEAVPKPLKG
jgi:hypothetical protein